MTRLNQDATDAELAILQALWDGGPAPIRSLVVSVYGETGTSSYATVQKLLDRLESKGLVERDRSGPVHVFQAIVDRDALIQRRLRSVADTLCGGSLAPILSQLVRDERLSVQERKELRGLIDDLDRKTKA